MQNVSNRERFENLKAEFILVTKRIIKEKLSTNPDTLSRYYLEIVDIHDTIVSFVVKFFNSLDNTNRAYFRNELIYIRDKTLQCFGKLSIDSGLSKQLLAKINGNAPGRKPQTNFNDDVSFSLELFESQNTANMSANALTSVEFLRIAAQTLNRNYNGDPLGLEAFLSSIDLLSELATTDALRVLLLKFVKAKLEGRALESIPTEANTIEIIRASLRAKIKPDSSKVITGRMLALRAERSKMVDFTKQAEELSEALQRSLIIEGISQEKAREMTVEKAVELCRNTTRSDLVKSVLASSKFDSPTEVFAKFVVETSTDSQERQVLAYRQQRNANNTRGQYNRARGGRGNRNFHNTGNYQNNNGNYGYGQNNGYRNRGGSHRGRGGGRPFQNNRNWRTERNVRFTENDSGPSAPQGWRAEQNNQPMRGPQNHIPYQQN